jgi:hypothetical protein
MKKEATPKTHQGSSKKISDEKRGNPKNATGLTEKRPPTKKEANPRMQRAQ